MIEIMAKEIARMLDRDWREMTKRDKANFYCAAYNAVIKLGEVSKEMVLRGAAELENCTDSSWDSGSDGESYNSYTYLIDGAQTIIFKAMLECELNRFDDLHPELNDRLGE